ncbi:MAG: glycoside hydrolase family 19 protein [Fibromonadales bacterium]|nr:glycoside hydrolase family 19 protein [Fibromonadales bacterium]
MYLSELGEYLFCSQASGQPVRCIYFENGCIQLLDKENGPQISVCDKIYRCAIDYDDMDYVDRKLKELQWNSVGIWAAALEINEMVKDGKYIFIPDNPEEVKISIEECKKLRKPFILELSGDSRDWTWHFSSGNPKLVPVYRFVFEVFNKVDRLLHECGGNTARSSGKLPKNPALIEECNYKLSAFLAAIPELGYDPKIQNEDKETISLDSLCKINNNKNARDCEYYVKALNKVLPSYKINSPLRLAHFFAQIIHESGHLHYKEEGLNYSASALRKIFPKYFPNDEIANEYARKPEKIANRTYCNRMGNGSESGGDGWKYRGRGLIQLTGHNNYKICGEALNLDLRMNPDLLCQNPEVIVRSACWFWASRDLNKFADTDDVMAITKKINGGINGIVDRKSNLAIAKKVFGC